MTWSHKEGYFELVRKFVFALIHERIMPIIIIGKFRYGKHIIHAIVNRQQFGFSEFLLC